MDCAVRIIVFNRMSLDGSGIVAPWRSAPIRRKVM